MYHRAELQREDAIGKCQHQIEIMFDDDNRNMLAQCIKHAEQFQHDSGCQSLKWLVQQKKLDVSRQCARNGDHLLFAYDATNQRVFDFDWKFL